MNGPVYPARRSWNMPRIPDDDSFEQLSPAHREAEGEGSSSGQENQAGQSIGRRNKAGQAAGRPAPAAGGRSLKARAVAYLSRREYSRLELQRKLQPYAEDPSEIGRVLDELEREQWLSDERFAQALVHRKARRQGAALIVQELRRHGLPDERVDTMRAQLQGTELERARLVWGKKFGGPPRDAREYARQYRFLASRGFSADCLRRILGEQDDASDA